MGLLMKRFVRVTGNIVANLAVLCLCPFLILAWIVRVRMHERAHQRASATSANTGSNLQRTADSKRVFTIVGGSAR
jgi:hypothetical protein